MHKFFHCPVCGEEVKIGAKVCPECGADENTGWKKEYLQNEYDYDTLDLGDDEFNYDEFIQREFGVGKPKKKSGKELTIAGIALFIVIIWVLYYIL